MGGKTMWVVMVLAGAVALFVWQGRRHDVSRSLAGITYTLHCSHCKAEARLTTQELNRMVAAGQATSPAGQMRQFKCGRCGKLGLIMDAGVSRGAP